MLIDLLAVMVALLAVWILLFGIKYQRKREAQIIARRAQGNKILCERFRNAARRAAAGYEVKEPTQLTNRSSPDDRARWLLHHLLSAQQWQQYEEYGWFHAGWYKQWPIFIGDGTVGWGNRRYCVLPISQKHSMPRIDVLIAQLLHARTNPRKLIRTGQRIN